MKKFSRPDRVRTGIQAHRREMAKANAPKAKGKTKAKAAAGKMHGDLQRVGQGLDARALAVSCLQPSTPTRGMWAWVVAGGQGGRVKCEGQGIS